MNTVDRSSNELLMQLDIAHLRKPHVAYDLDRIAVRRNFLNAVADKLKRLTAELADTKAELSSRVKMIRNMDTERDRLRAALRSAKVYAADIPECGALRAIINNGLSEQPSETSDG